MAQEKGNKTRLIKKIEKKKRNAVKRKSRLRDTYLAVDDSVVDLVVERIKKKYPKKRLTRAALATEISDLMCDFEKLKGTLNE